MQELKCNSVTRLDKPQRVFLKKLKKVLTQKEYDEKLKEAAREVCAKIISEYQLQDFAHLNNIDYTGFENYIFNVQEFLQIKADEEKLRKKEEILNDPSDDNKEYTDGIDYEPITFGQKVYKIGKLETDTISFINENGKSEVVSFIKYPKDGGKVFYHYYRGEKIDPDSQVEIPPIITHFNKAIDAIAANRRNPANLVDPRRNAFSKAALSILKSTGEVIIDNKGNPIDVNGNPIDVNGHPIQSRGGKRKPKSRSKSAK
jgi:hypothetical protein